MESSNGFLSKGIQSILNDADPSKTDVAKIEQKIKKIHKKRRGKIEPLENVYTSPQKEGFTLDFLGPKQTSEPMSLGEKEDTEEDASPKETIQEPFGAIKEIKNKFHMLMDKIQKLIAYFFFYSHRLIDDVFLYLPKKTRETIHEYSREINKHFSVETADIKEKDSKIITDTVMKLLIFPMCVIVAYNWFYLTIMYDEFAFKTANKDADPPISYIFFRYASDENRMKIDWGKDDYLNFFLYFTIKPLEWVDSFLFGDRFKVSKYIYFLTEEENGDHYWEMPITMPYLMSLTNYLIGRMHISRMTNKLIIFFFAIMFIYQFDFFSVVIDSLDNTKTTLLKGFCFLVIFIHYMYYTAKYIIFHIPKKIDWNTAFAIKGGFIYFAWIVIYATIRFSIALASVNFSALIIILYVWFHFIGAVLFYGQNSGMLDAFDKINAFIDEEIMSSSKDCYEDRGFMNIYVAFQFFRKMIIFINDNLVTLAFLFMLFKSYTGTRSDIVSHTVKSGFGYLFILIAIIVIYMFVWPKVEKLFTQKRSEYKVADDPGTYVGPDGTKYKTGGPIQENKYETKIPPSETVEPEKKFKGRMYDQFWKTTQNNIDKFVERVMPPKKKPNVLEKLPGEVPQGPASTDATGPEVTPVPQGPSTGLEVTPVPQGPSTNLETTDTQGHATGPDTPVPQGPATGP